MVVHAYYADETRVRREAEALLRDDYQVDIICLKEKGERAFEIINGIGIYRLSVKRHQGSGPMIYLIEYCAFFFLSGLVLFFKFLKRRYKIIQIHNIPDFLVLTALIPKIFGSKVVFDMHELTPELLITKWHLANSHLIIKMAFLAEKLSAKFSDYIIAISKTCKAILTSRGIPDSKIAIITNSADNNIFQTNPFSRARILSPKKFILIYHGSLVHLQGVDVAIKAFAAIKQELADVEFRIYGRGDAFAELQKLIVNLGIEKNVKLLGFVPVDDIPSIINKADIAIVPRRKNILTDLAIPTKIFEYILLNKPVIVTKTAAVAERFDSRAVAFFESGNDDDLARRILELYHNSQKRAALVRHAREQYKPISWEVMSKRYIGLVNSLRQKGEKHFCSE